MIHIGIDQSYTSTGVVVLEDDKILDFCTIHTSPNDGDVFTRVNTVASKLKALCEYDVCSIAIEGLAFGIRGSATRDLAGLQFVIVDYLRFQLNKDILIVAPTSLKKFATGGGGGAKKKVTKAMMVDSLNEDTKLLFKTKYKASNGLYDITDAYFLAKYSQSKETQ